jgi:hypothetical protein
VPLRGPRDRGGAGPSAAREGSDAGRAGGRLELIFEHATTIRAAARLWLAAAVAACAAAYTPTAAPAGDTHQDSSYVLLSGVEARQFLVGNSVEDSPAMTDGSGAGPGVRYLVNEKSSWKESSIAEPAS